MSTTILQDYSLLSTHDFLVVLRPDVLILGWVLLHGPALGRNALALPECDRRAPVLGLPRRMTLGVEFVDLLERQALGLVDIEVDKGNAQEAAAEPYEEDLALQVGVARTVVDQVGSRIRNSPVQEPLLN